jgi:uncharacterized NAD(P)/FAD-binding protein YdhS
LRGTMSFNFAIVGGGLAGTSMLCHFVRKLQDAAAQGFLAKTRIGIRVFEKQDVFGPGFPHCDRYVMPYHITNMCDGDMGILDGRREDFRDWVEINRSLLQERFQDFGVEFSKPDVGPDRCRHYPRAVVGKYLTTRFQEAVAAARQLGIKVKLHPGCEVTDIREKDRRVLMTAKDLRTGTYFLKVADRVLLATGHWFERTDQENYFTSPWPAEKLLRSIPLGVNVAVIGTSLSAIETVLTLTSDGEFIRDDSGRLDYRPSSCPRKITLYSRGGMLPKVRGRTGRYRNRFLAPENVERLISENNGHLPLELIFQLLNSDLEAAYGRSFDWEGIVNSVGSQAELLQQYLNDAASGDGPDGELIWQTVLHQAFPMARMLYLSLTPEDRNRFDEKYTTLFFMHAATQPSINAEKLLALIQSNIVRVIKLGDDYRLVRNDAGGCFEFHYRDTEGRTERDVYRYVVNARGQEKSIATDPSELTANLIRSKTAAVEEHGLPKPATSPGRRLAAAQKSSQHSNKNGSIWIDPESHRIRRKASDGTPTASPAIYAVGAMTRGQILDASMAYGLALSTAAIAQEVVDYLTGRANRSSR